MSPTDLRIRALTACNDHLEPWIGPFDEAALRSLVACQLGSGDVLDEWIPRGDTRCRAFPLSPLLHVVSGNTPHAAFQSVVRGLLVGSRNRVKIPSSGLPEFESWIGEIPAELADLIEVRRDLPPHWLESAGAIVFGNQATLETFRALLPRPIPLIEHGPKLSIAVIFQPDEIAAGLVAADILSHDQLGCLSVQAVYVDGSPEQLRSFSARLARALETARPAHPRGVIGLSDSGAISNARELARFRAANGENVALWESEENTEWTVVEDQEPRLIPGPLHGFVTVHPLPGAARLRDGLGPEVRHLSTAAIHPFQDELADRLDALEIPRICPLGHAQKPPLFWHHDGRPPLADLVVWRDRSP